MVAMFRSWWQQIKQHRVTILIVAILFVVLIVIIIIGYQFDWTGFGGFNNVTITRIISGTNAGTVTRTEVYQPGKSLWDWLQLLGILAIPVVVGFGAVWFTTRQGKVADAENKDNQRETALQAYINKMSELLLKNGLREAKPDAEVRSIARAQTLTVLHRLDGFRKGSVIQFLSESQLISCIDLNGADLREADLWNHDLRGAQLGPFADLSRSHLVKAHLDRADLHQCNLDRADLSNADLSNAKLGKSYLGYAQLSGAILIGADLSEANLNGARIAEEQLKQAKSLKGATMPDGSIHP